MNRREILTTTGITLSGVALLLRPSLAYSGDETIEKRSPECDSGSRLDQRSGGVFPA